MSRIIHFPKRKEFNVALAVLIHADCTWAAPAPVYQEVIDHVRYKSRMACLMQRSSYSGLHLYT